MSYLFTSESVSEGHPDKIADQISDALLDEFLRMDPESKVACETLVTTGLVVCSGEVHTNGYVDIQKVVRETIRRIGYTKAEYKFDADSCGVISTIHEQSPDIRQGVDKEDDGENQGAGDQGVMFGMASKDMDNYMPMPVELAHILLQELAAIRKEAREMTYLRPDSKSQVTIEYDDNDNPLRVHTIVLSTQHDEFIMPADDSRQAVKEAERAIQEKIKDDVMHILIPRVISTLPDRIKPLFKPGFQLHVNPTGKFVTGGPNGDTGLTGRKIIVDTYGGKGLHGGGAFSGKDCSKVDRSGAYAARHIAKNLVAAGVCDEVQVQIAYAIGIADPVGVYVNTNHTAHIRDDRGNIMHDGEISEKIKDLFSLRPCQIIKRFGLKNPIFLETTTYGHFGRDHFEREVEVFYENSETYRKTVNGQERIFKKVEFFPWEKLDYINILRKEFNL